MPAFPRLSSALSDGAVSLRPFAERDIPEILIAHQDDPQLHRRLDEPRPPSAAELGRRAERAEADRLAGARLTLSIVTGGGDLCRGQVHVHELDWDSGRARLEVWVAPGWRGRGRARRAHRHGVAVAGARGSGKLGGMAQSRVKVPPGVRPPFEVYVNGVRQELGADYRVAGGELVFSRQLVQQRLGLRAWLLGFWGIGTYKRNDEIDIRYELDGRPMVAHVERIEAAEER